MESKSNFYVIILAAGYATRLRPLSNKIPKSLIDINGKTIISRIIQNFKGAGFNKFCVIVGYKKELVKEEVLKNKDLEIITIEQEEPKGMADAIVLAINFILQKKKKITSFFISAADIIFPKEAILKMYNLYGYTDIVLSLMKSNDTDLAMGHGNVQLSDDSDLGKDLDREFGVEIIDIIEKPKPHEILSSYYSLPLYIVNQKLMKIVNELKISERGEKEFQDVLKTAIYHNMNIRGIRVVNSLINNKNIGEFHLTNLKDIINMNNRFLSGLTLEESKGITPKLLEPVRIKSDNRFGVNVILGPYAIIGNSCKVGDDCEISNTILYDRVNIGKSCKLDWCIIDEGVSLPKNFRAEECFITRNNRKDLEIINF
ncbi:MAG: sugar phosphate nucleotidyltransferase [Candidatus Thorarchaeota archaeon]